MTGRDNFVDCFLSHILMLNREKFVKEVFSNELNTVHITLISASLAPVSLLATSRTLSRSSCLLFSLLTSVARLLDSCLASCNSRRSLSSLGNTARREGFTSKKERKKEFFFFLIIVFVQGGSPTPHPFSSRPHFVFLPTSFFFPPDLILFFFFSQHTFLFEHYNSRQI
jgi:hypothetical protein